MIVDIFSSKASVFNECCPFLAKIVESQLERQVVIDLRNSLTDVIFFCYGFGSVLNDITEYLEKYDSLKALGERTSLR